MGKKFELDGVVSKLKEGKKAKDIAKDFNISKSNLSYYLAKLKKQGVIKYKGHGIWLVQKSLPTQLGKSKQIRGHAFIWKIDFLKEINWKKQLSNSKLKYKTQSNGKVFRIFFLGKKVWFTKKGLIIYEPYNFWGDSAYESKGKAVYKLDRYIKNLLFKLKIRELPYRFTTSREHFAIVNEEMARQYNERGEKLYIRREDGTAWCWIDFSHGINENEQDNVKDNIGMQNYLNDKKKNNFRVTDSFILEVMNGHNQQIGQVVQDQEIFNKNIALHQSVLDEMLVTLKKIQESLDGNSR